MTNYLPQAFDGTTALKSIPSGIPQNGASALALPERESPLTVLPQVTRISAPAIPDFQTVQSFGALAEWACKSSMSKARTKEDAFFIMMYGYEVGISPMTALRTIYAVNGTPTCSGEAMLALIRKSRLAEIKLPDTDEVKKTQKAVVWMKRRDTGEEYTASFSKEDAQKAGLWDSKDTWKKYPHRMLLWRAVSDAAKSLFSDVIGGLYTVEEIAPDTDVDENGEPIGAITTQPQLPAPKQNLENANKTRVDTTPKAAEKWNTPETVADFLRNAQSRTQLDKAKIAALLEIGDPNEAAEYDKYPTRDAASSALKAAIAHVKEQSDATPVAAGNEFAAAKVTVKLTNETRKITLFSMDGKQSASVFSIEKFLSMLQNTGAYSNGASYWREWLEEITDQDNMFSLMINMHCDLMVTWEAKTSNGKEYHNAVTLREIEPVVSA